MSSRHSGRVSAGACPAGQLRPTTDEQTIDCVSNVVRRDSNRENTPSLLAGFQQPPEPLTVITGSTPQVFLGLHRLQQADMNENNYRHVYLHRTRLHREPLVPSPSMISSPRSLKWSLTIELQELTMRDLHYISCHVVARSATGPSLLYQRHGTANS